MASCALTLALAGLHGGSAWATTPTEPAAEQRWSFRVLLDDRHIGEHRFNISSNGQHTQAVIEAEFAVKFAFITAYEYLHTNVEQWQGDCLSSITSSTDDNGKKYMINGATGDQGFSLVRNDEPLLLEQNCVHTFAYWRPDTILDQRELLNSQTGEVQPVSVRFAGLDEVPYQGSNIASRQYVLSTEDGDISLWYALHSGTWLALEAPTESGRVLRYEPQLLPEDALASTPPQEKLSLR